MLPALALLCLLPTPAAQEELERPNVVVIAVDDLGWADLGCTGSEYFETPHIDRLAAHGMRFTDAYAAAAICSPTRAALQTGRYPARIGITDWIRARFQGGHMPADGKNPSGYQKNGKRPLETPRNPLWMEHEEVTLAEVLGEAGYATGFIGKWHLGLTGWYPDDQGYDENVGGCDYGQPPTYFDPYVRDGKYDMPTLAAREEGEYLTDREGFEAERFLREHADGPFLLFYAPYAVHTPLQAKAELIEHYRAKPKTQQKNATYAAMVHSVDDAVGRVLATLEDLGLAENTLVVFTSDNGGLLGPTNNAPLRSGKGYPYEGGIRVPFLVRWPGVVAAGSVSSTPVSSIDLFPTLLEACGLDAPENVAIDGVDLGRLLRAGDDAAPERDALFWHFPHYRGKDVVPYSIVRQGRWKLIRYWEGPRFELFDLESDLGETEELSSRNPAKVRELEALLEAHLAKVGAELPR